MYDAIQQMRDDINATPREIAKRFQKDGRKSAYYKMNVFVEVRQSSSLSFVFSPETLKQFCYLELLHARIGRANIYACEACGQILPITRNGRPRRHCDDACKQKAYYRRRAQRSGLLR
jgi:hypothetical protein